VYALPASWYAGGPRLCKGDCAGDTLLVDREHSLTIIEVGPGLDPAAYEPDDMPLFRRRVQAHRVVLAIETILVLDEHRHAFDMQQREDGVRAEWSALTRLLSSALA
jgi:hypothetical protein